MKSRTVLEGWSNGEGHFSENSCCRGSCATARAAHRPAQAPACSSGSSAPDIDSASRPDGPGVLPHPVGPQPPLATRGSSQSRSPTTATTTAPVVMSSQDMVASFSSPLPLGVRGKDEDTPPLFSAPLPSGERGERFTRISSARRGPRVPGLARRRRRVPRFASATSRGRHTLRTCTAPTASGSCSKYG
jgi:hypothetical protein